MSTPTFTPGDRVVVQLPGRGKAHTGTIITVMPRNDGCERVRFDGKKEPHTIHRQYLTHAPKETL